ncbi:hypothetical protein AR457_32095 [Streptomyces agglomeratus]|uniref:J domain-containing protein n=1 Tax=Streptomyces agglomeratus TaxID=285458 RepID=A0A1E5PGC0_9ACTN|nr:hypothetical protein AS594_32000 [Streptomyces agglomeratus]OEJ37514.1 hypothetical protein BGK70_04555 [Streptomyces agglomeratus]OEJ48102.1 hypothetical protein AR457_32095 [Streptomyces agglomeratus]OEJ50055.1 hypothetical protein BGK72_04070 [Streptomyces agglomeratus]OEJ57383.1 hypothetical protein BGM19_04750 [Streptomyces agglomeratus]
MEPTASAGQITAAYRRLVRALHPDTRPDGPAADGRFTDVVVAYSTLHDPVLRAEYDSRLGLTGPAEPVTRDTPVDVRGTRMPHAARVTVRVTVHPAPPRRDAPLWAGPTRVRPAPDASGRPRPHRVTGWDLLWKWSTGW